MEGPEPATSSAASRANELEQLRRAWSTALTGQPGLVLVEGEAGIGKSWLLRSFRSGLRTRTALVSTPPLLPGLLRAAAPLLAQEREGEFLAAAHAVLPTGPWAGALATSGHVVGREGTWLAVGKALARVAWRWHGLCLLIEDLHSWSDDDRLALTTLYGYALRADAPMLFVITSRPGQQGELLPALLLQAQLAKAQAPQLLTLSALDEGGTLGLAQDLLHTSELPDTLIEWLHQRAGGHPLHTLELLRFLLEGGALDNRGYLWHFRPPTGAVLPHSLQSTLLARLETAARDPELWQALTALAVLDRPVALPAWSRLCGLGRDSLEELGGEAARLGLVKLWLHEGSTQYALSHALYPAAVRAMLPRSERRRLHVRVAEHSDDPGERAHHGRLAGHERAQEWSWEALDTARQRFEHAQAERHARALLELGAGPAALASSERREQELGTILGETLYLQGKFEEAVEALQSCSGAEARRLEALSLRRLGRFEKALTAARLGLESISSAEERDATGSVAVPTPSSVTGSDEVFAGLRALEASLLLQLGRRDEGNALLAALLEEAPAASHARALALLEQGRLEHSANRFREALDATVEAADALRKLGDVAELSRALNNIGIFASQLGRWEQSKSALTECIALSEARGDHALLASRYLNLGSLHYRQGEYGSALEVYARALRLAEATGDSEVRANALVSLAEVHFLRGELERAAASYRQGLEQFRALGAAAAVETYGLALAQVEAFLAGDVCLDHPAYDLSAHPLLPLIAADISFIAGRRMEAVDILSRVDESALRPTARVQYRLASSLSAMMAGRWEEAQATLEEALLSARAQGHGPLQGQALVYLAVVQLGLADLGSEGGRSCERDGFALFRQGLELVTESGAWGHLLTLRRLFPEAFGRLEGSAAAGPEQRLGVVATVGPGLQRGTPFLRVLGGFELEQDGARVAWKARRPRELLALLLIAGLRESGPWLPRAQILAALWPESGEEQAEASFRTTLKRLREVLGDPELIERNGQGDYRLDGIRADVLLFLDALRRGDQETAVGWYGGELLPSLELPGIGEVRERLRTRFREAAFALASHASHERAAELYGRLLEDDPFDLEAITELGRCLKDQGDQRHYRRVLDRICRHFQEELGELPAEVEALLERQQLSR